MSHVPRVLSRRGLVVGLAAGSVASMGRPRRARARGPGGHLAGLASASVDLGEARIDAEGWRERVADALAGVDAQALAEALGIDWKPVLAAVAERGYVSRALDPAQLPGLSVDTALRPKVFGLGRGRAILPHAHRHIVSVFVVLSGRVRGRHYDRVRDEAGAIVIRPSDDRELGPGAVAAIADRRANVHWFTGLGDAALLFNCSVPLPASLRRDPSSSGRLYIDPEGEVLEEGLVRAPRTTLTALRAKYEAHSM